MADMTRKEKMQIRFMENTMSRINSCLIYTYALQSLLIKKGIFNEDELRSEIEDARKLPATATGRSVLKAMIQDFKLEDHEGLPEGDEKINTKTT